MNKTSYETPLTDEEIQKLKRDYDIYLYNSKTTKEACVDLVSAEFARNLEIKVIELEMKCSELEEKLYEYPDDEKYWR